MAADTKAQRAREARSPHTGDAATAEVVARFGQDNLEAILEVYRAFANRVDYRALMAWTMREPLEDLLMPVFLRALIEITKGLRLGELAQELAAAQAEHAPAGDLADTLHATAHDLQAHIEQRAQEIAGPRIAEAERDYHAKAATLRREHKQQTQRSGDLITELRRQLRVLGRTQAELKELRDLRKRVIQRLTVQATGPNGERWADYDALTAAVFPKAETEAT